MLTENKCSEKNNRSFFEESFRSLEKYEMMNHFLSVRIDSNKCKNLSSFACLFHVYFQM